MCFCYLICTTVRLIGLSRGSTTFCEDFWMQSSPYRPLAVESLLSYALCRYRILLQSSARALVSPLFVYSWIFFYFGIGVFLLLDELPSKANESHLPVALVLRRQYLAFVPSPVCQRRFQHGKAGDGLLVVIGYVLHLTKDHLISIGCLSPIPPLGIKIIS